jgi:hypothetical protein
MSIPGAQVQRGLSVLLIMVRCVGIGAAVDENPVQGIII